MWAAGRQERSPLLLFQYYTLPKPGYIDSLDISEFSLYVHPTLNAPDPIYSQKLSRGGLCCYLDGRRDQLQSYQEGHTNGRQESSKKRFNRLSWEQSAVGDFSPLRKYNLPYRTDSRVW